MMGFTSSVEQQEAENKRALCPIEWTLKQPQLCLHRELHARVSSLYKPKDKFEQQKKKNVQDMFVFSCSSFVRCLCLCTCTETQPCSFSCNWIMSTSWQEHSLVNSAVRAFISSIATSTGLSSTCFSATTSTRFFTYGKVLAAVNKREK